MSFGVLQRSPRALIVVAGLVCHAACEGPQSTLMPAGRDAERIFQLWTIMAIGAGIIWAAIVGIAFYATRLRTGSHHPRLTHGLIIGGGAVFPVATLSALLIWGLMALPAVLALPSPGGMTVSITGHQWWWRVRYMMPDNRDARWER